MKDEDEDEYVVKQITDFPGFRPMMSLGFATEEKRDECFNDYTEENAKKFVESIEQMSSQGDFSTNKIRVYKRDDQKEG